MLTKLAVLIALCGALLPAIAQADTTLTFTGQGPNDFDPIASSYGSNQPTTPDITVGYKTLYTGGSLYTSYLDYWTTGYGDLVGVAFASKQGMIAEVDLTPASGHSVTLRSFDMAGWLHNDLQATTLKVTDGLSTIDYAGLTGYTVKGAGPSHSSFNPNFTSTNTVKIQWGTNWNLGIDNIVFAQDVKLTATPEPGSIALLIGLGVSGSAFFARRRRSARKAA